MFSPLTVKTPIARAPTRPASCANRILGTLPRAPSEIFTSIQFKIVLHCWRHFFSDTTSNCAPVPRLAQPQAGNFYYAELICCSASNPRIALNSLEDPAAQPRYHPPAAPRLGAQEPASRARGFYGARRAASTSSGFISSDKDLPTRNNIFAAAFTQS